MTVSIKVCTPRENIVSKLEVMLKEWLPKDFRIDFHGEHISNHLMSDKLTVLLLMLNGQKVIGGAILADGLSLNDFKDNAKIDKVEEYKKENILNFSYFYILPEYRQKGLGSEFLTQLQTLYPYTWLASHNKRLGFYNRNNYEVVFASSVEDKYSLLVSKGIENATNK